MSPTPARPPAGYPIPGDGLPPWIPYANRKPETPGPYRWSVPSVGVPGIVVTFVANTRKRSAGFDSTISPVFDHWNGYSVTVPTGTLWMPAEVAAPIQNHQFAEIAIEGQPLNAPCPFCNQVPTWKGVESVQSGGILCGAAPYQYNKWWLECCAWSRTPHVDDPRFITSHRNAALAMRTGGAA